MAREKKPIHKVQMTEGKRNIIHQLLEEYDIQTAEDIQDALKDLLGGTIKEMMEAEIVFCKHFLDKVAKHFWTLLQVQIGKSCKASTGSYPASRIAIADHI